MDRTYQSLFPQAFPGERNPFTIVNVAKAIATFERSIVSARSPYDRYHYAGEQNAISDSAKRGEVLFFTDPWQRATGAMAGSTLAMRLIT